MSKASEWRKREATPETNVGESVVRVTRRGFSVNESSYIIATDDEIVALGRWLIETFEER